MTKSTDKTPMSQAQIIEETSFNSWRNWRVFYLPLILYAIAIFMASSSTAPPAPNLGFDLQDKLYHLLAYGVLGVLLIRCTQSIWGRGRWVYVASIAFGILYGVTDEFHQSFVPGRFADVYDGLADAFGVWLGHAGYRRWQRRRGGLKTFFS